jgi:hypothetical protein
VECSSRVGLRAFAGSSYVSVTGAVADTVFDARQRCEEAGGGAD